MGKKSRDKGYRGERELLNILCDVYGYSVKRGRFMEGMPDLYGLWGIHIECKRHEKLEIPSWYKQSLVDSKRFNNGIPTVFHRKNGEKWLVTLAYYDWYRMNGEPCELMKNGNTYRNVEKHGRVRYIREGFDLITLTLEEFMDIYGGWINDREI